MQHTARGVSASGLLLLVVASAFPQTAAAQEPSEDPAGPRLVSVSVGALGSHLIYTGKVFFHHAGEQFRANYREQPDTHLAARAKIRFYSDRFGELGAAILVARGLSTGSYDGLGSPKSFRRQLLTLGLDVGWRPDALVGDWGSLRFPFGPSLIWRSLDLSSGHQDAFADPDALVKPEVAWSDRGWVSFGGYGGMSLDVRVSRRMSVTMSGTGRFFFSDHSAWSDREERDIRASTGHTVRIAYERPVVFFWFGSAGLQWHW